MHTKTTVYQKEILRDCRRAMLPSTCIYILQETLFAVISVYISAQLGEFFNGIIYMEFAGVMAVLGKMLVCIFAGVVVIPAMDYLGQTTMLRNALAHDRIVIRRFLGKRYEEAMKMDESEVQYRLENDAIELRSEYQELIVKSAVLFCGGLFLLYQALPMSPLYTVIVFCLSCVRLVTPICVRNIRARFDFQNREYKTSVRVCESMFTKNTWLAKMYGLSEGILQNLQKLFEDNYEKVESKKISFNAVTGSVTNLVNRLSYIIILFAGACFVSSGSIRAGVIAAMLGYLSVFDILVQNGKYMIETVPVLNNLTDRMTLLYEGEETEAGEILKEPIAKVETRQFQYQYKKGFREENAEENRKDDAENNSDGGRKGIAEKEKKGNEENTGNNGRILSCPDITVEPSKAAFVKGANGCGKSTLLKVICGFCTGYDGSIRINGRELRTLNLPRLRRQIGYLEQEPYLFAGTVRENIQLGDLSASDEQVEAAAKEAGIAHLLEETVGVENTRLSGGEQQKVALARLLQKDAALMLLDEPEHFLDSDSRQWLEEKIIKSQKLIVCVRHEREQEKKKIEKSDR